MAARKGPGFSARPVLKINLNAIRENYRYLNSISGDARIGASLKADAYGLGADKVGKALYGCGCRTFFVATAGEGQALRRTIGTNASIYVLNGPAPRDIALFFGANLKPVLNSLHQAELWAEHANNASHAPHSAVHIDTGMNRLGFETEDFIKFSKNKSLQSAVSADLVMSHLACAPDSDNPMNERQLKSFKQAAARLQQNSLSLANTAGIFLGPRYRFDVVRPGIGLYGGKATLKPELEGTQSVVTLDAPILQLRTVKAGDTIGYNGSFKANKSMTVAIVGAGYADGIPISASQQQAPFSNYGIIKTKKAPILGRVSMDLTTLDVSHIRDLKVGEQASFRGSNLENDANAANTLNYELLVRLGTHRCRRDYV